MEPANPNSKRGKSHYKSAGFPRPRIGFARFVLVLVYLLFRFPALPVFRLFLGGLEHHSRTYVFAAVVE